MYIFIYINKKKKKKKKRLIIKKRNFSNFSNEKKINANLAQLILPIVLKKVYLTKNGRR